MKDDPYPHWWYKFGDTYGILVRHDSHDQGLSWFSADPHNPSRITFDESVRINCGDYVRVTESDADRVMAGWMLGVKGKA